MNPVRRRRIVVDDSALAGRIGERLRAARKRAGLTQQQLAEGRYTKAYVSALEKGLAKPSMAALNFFAERLGLPASRFLSDETPAWTRLEADLLLASGRWQEALDAYDVLLERPGDRPARAELQRARAEALCRLDRGGEAIAPASEAVETFDRLGRDVDAALASYWLGYALYESGNMTESRSVLGALLGRIRGGLQVEPDFKLRLFVASASVESWEGDHHKALTYLHEAANLTGDLDDRRRAAFLHSLASNYREGGDLEAAIRTGTEALHLFRAADARREESIVENNLALAYLAVGNGERARELAARSHARLEELGDERELAHVLETEAQIELGGGDIERALELAERAVSTAEATGNNKALTSALLTIAKAHVRAGRLEQATTMYERAASLVRGTGPVARLQQVLGEWADVLASLGQHQQAYALTREALQAAATAVSLPASLTSADAARPR